MILAGGNGTGEIMPGLQTALGQLNTAFGRDGIKKMVAHREKFAPGKPLAAGVVVTDQMAIHDSYAAYISDMPLSIQEAIRSVIYYALDTKPPTQITFAWAPGYDYELTIWHAPDAAKTRGGITVLVKGRYPDDTHPLAPKA